MNLVNLQPLLDLPGAIAAFAHGEGGDLANYRILEHSDMSESMLDMIAHMCAANRCIASMQARGWERVTGAQGFYPVNGFGLIGFDWSVISRGRLGVVVASEMTDYEACIAAMDSLQDEAFPA
jgi:roadblock/LC7 domain-containing protein